MLEVLATSIKDLLHSIKAEATMAEATMAEATMADHRTEVAATAGHHTEAVTAADRPTEVKPTATEDRHMEVVTLPHHRTEDRHTEAVTMADRPTEAKPTATADRHMEVVTVAATEDRTEVKHMVHLTVFNQQAIIPTLLRNKSMCQIVDHHQLTIHARLTVTNIIHIQALLSATSNVHSNV